MDGKGAARHDSTWSLRILTGRETRCLRAGKRFAAGLSGQRGCRSTGVFRKSFLLVPEKDLFRSMS